ncbi:PCYCGC motif-containing (lipo)protein [Paenibacillus turpanensis]|uniref:PCYCGC motif-containing (lipo)protein n=1 Tax=Paenibacillus turpanensis TaxID=2689078 RepID=UPI001407CD56|nr:PCYCGC motif-containing (lipo)protein [Paenibacillus turpanensis]
MKSTRWIWTGLSVITILLALTGCFSRNDGHKHNDAEIFEFTKSADVMPKFLAQYTDNTQQLYAQVEQHADILKQLDCYCGCMDYDDPHDSLYRCFVRSHSEKGIEWTNHGATCGVCLLELRDTIEGVKQGKSAEQIRMEIDKTYKNG